MTAFESPEWYRAATLRERVADLFQGDIDPPAGAERTRGERRLERWRSEFHFAEDDGFATRLAHDQISEQTLLALLSEPAEAVRQRCSVVPDWLQRLEHAFIGQPQTGDEAVSQFAGFAEIVRPLIEPACRRLQREVEELIRSTPAGFLTLECIPMALANLSAHMEPMLTRTMALELNVARLEDLLDGNTPGERFHSFLARLRRPEHGLVLLKEYPVLARQLAETVQRWAEVSSRFFRRLAADTEAIKATFAAGENPGTLVRVKGGAGDHHRGGQCVQIAEFSSGFRVVYKPRSLAVDAHFQELLAWLNIHGATPSFRTLEILDRGDYGWMEFVEPQGCASSEGIKRFYERQGAYLALLYMLDGTDFHQENLIAAGEHPVLVDLEALFHPRMPQSGPQEAEMKANAILNESVLRTGLLPMRIWGDGRSEGIDLSGLSTASEQLTPFAVPMVEGFGTDQMCLTRKRAPMPAAHHRPTLNGEPVEVREHVDAILSGFRTTYRLMARHRESLLADGGPLSRFEQDEVRLIPLPTNFYAALLRDSYHPDYLRDALDRDRLFDRLWAPALHQPHLIRLIPAQRMDLENNDIPAFTARISSRHAWTSSGECVQAILNETPMAVVRRRFELMDNENLNHQAWIIRAALATLARESERPQLVRYSVPADDRAPAIERLLKHACAAGDWLEGHAWRVEDAASWIGLTLGQDRCWSLAPVGLDLYDGLPGIALFLAHLGSLTGESRYTSLAEAALTGIRRNMRRAGPQLTTIGGFSGWGGLVYSLSELGVLWKRRDLLDDAVAAVDAIAPLVERDDQFDIIGGAAGCIGALVALYRNAPSRRILEVATACGDHLLGRAVTADDGIGWLTPAAATVPLCGFSHGAAGIAWALLELSALIGEPRFRNAAMRAIAYERSLYSTEHNNWPDLREQAGNENPMFATAWCHGAPGIGLARLRALPHIDDAVTRSEIDAALRATAGAGPGMGHCLCHGDLGNLELFLLASGLPGGGEWRTQTNRFAAAVLGSIERDGWRCGLPLDVRSPGLMTGVAGIGYGLLRLADPKRIPSVLRLDGTAVAEEHCFVA